ncbi:MAG: thioredoxin domain-containing protein [Synergistaceae bacterium]|nr:thioredoxin domain-containing protein [Synergistaceae bacterium]
MGAAKSLEEENGLLVQDEYDGYALLDEPVVESQPQHERRAAPPVNRLGSESSLYLRQHARNPIGWYPWGQDAFDAAQNEDKPIFLSIGFSSCHWCHIMERDCFNDQEVAELMNDACIPVKVDREERPDLDGLFMDVCQVQNGSGGWPLNAFLTPDGRPFFVTTWLPKRTTGEMPGLTEILPRVKWLWLMQREDILRAARELTDTMKRRSSFTPGSRIGTVAVKDALEGLRNGFDLGWGGFGKGPKFPDAPRLLFLLKQADSPLNSDRERADAFTMVDVTLRRMWRGGIHDHLGGGFARYSTDERWLAPHFEKLLSTQALLLLTVALAQEHKSDAFYKLMAEDISGCVLRDFADESQAFCSSIDSESAAGEAEGRYYLWTDEEIHAALPEGEAGLFCAAYAVMPGGNFGSELAGSQIGLNILYETSSVAELARRYGLRGPVVAHKLAYDRRILFETRNKRPAPPRDEKVLMDWNGLMIGALARASSAFEKPEWRDKAERAALALQKTLPDPKGGWRRRLIGAAAEIPALAQDYAALLWGVMEVYRAAKKAEVGEKQLKDWLKYAQGLADAMIEAFWDEKNGGLFLSPADAPHVFLRRKAAEDGQEPSANALAALALSALGTALEEKKYADLARKIIACFARLASTQPLSYLSLISAAALWRPVKPKPLPKPEPEAQPRAEDIDGEGAPPAEPGLGLEEEIPRRGARAARRERTSGASRSERAERAERRSARPHRGARSRDR